MMRIKTMLVISAAVGSVIGFVQQAAAQGTAFTYQGQLIIGGSAGTEVSWELTGVRQDAWANAHRIPVEEAKPANERGTYLAPELHGQPQSKSVQWARHPESKDQTNHVAISHPNGAIQSQGH